MKRLIARWGIGLLLCLGACDDLPQIPPQPGLYNVLAQQPQLTRFRQLVDRAALADSLNTWINATLLAPHDTALAAFGLPDSAAVAAYPVAAAQRLVRYHVLRGLQASRALSLGQVYGTRYDSTFTFRPAESEVLIGVRIGTSVAVTGSAPARVNGRAAVGTTADLLTDNGILHEVGGVLLPPFANGGVPVPFSRNQHLLDLLVADSLSPAPRFTKLLAAVRRARSGTLRIEPQLTTGTSLLLLAPTDDAFTAAGYASTAAIASETPEFLFQLLDRHLGSSRLFRRDLAGVVPGTVATASAGPGGVVQLRVGGVVRAQVVQPFDQNTATGAFHAIDAVLPPL